MANSAFLLWLTQDLSDQGNRNPFGNWFPPDSTDIFGKSWRDAAFRIDNELQQAIKRREYEDSDGTAQLIPEFLPRSELATALLVMHIR